MTVSVRRILAAASATALLVVCLGAAAPGASAAAYTPCRLSGHAQLPPGGTPAYDLAVERRKVPCAVATRVMQGFHRCRTRSGTTCSRRVLRVWRCHGSDDGASPTLHGTFACAAPGGRRVRGSYWQDTPSCFGAAARDPQLPCRNNSRTTFPRPGQPDPNQSGWAPVAHATRHIALIGDSHTFHWRAALNVVLQAQSWDGYVLTDSGCFFNEEVGGFSQGCLDWYHRAQAWIRDHPEVDTIFLTSNADTPLPPRAGQTYEQVKTDGFRRALLALPSTVKHVIVLRDLTRAAPGTFGCIAAAIAAGTSRLAPLCPVPRSVALREDLAVAAVKSLHDPRFEYIDLSRYVCSAVNCYPVVGGAQVNADIYGHLLTPFMRTLGPYLLRELRRREASW